MIVYKSCWLIAVYSSGSDSVRAGGVSGSGVGDGDWWAEKTDLVLDSVSESYSKLEILVGASGPSSCPTYIVY